MTPAQIRAARARLGLSQPELAEALGVDRMTISRWERGERVPQSSEMLRLALERLEQTYSRRA